MTLNEIWEMTYDKYVQYLLTKYGGAKCDFFCTSECRSKGDVVRTNEGLECHHIDEDKYADLSSRMTALEYPFDYQKADRLVYADLIEHLILHIKIDEMGNCNKLCSGTEMIIGSINTMFEFAPTTGWRMNMYDRIKDNLDLYIEILHRLAKANFDQYIIERSNRFHNLIHPNNAEMIIPYDMNIQVDIDLLHKLANIAVEKYPCLWDCPKDKKTESHWYFLLSRLLRKDDNSKTKHFPIKVAKAFARHESKENYVFNDYSDKQMTINDLLTD